MLKGLVIISPEGNRLLTVSRARPSGYEWRGREARVWDLLTGRPLSVPLTMPRDITEARFSPDGKWVLLRCGAGPAKGPEVRVWSATAAQPDTPLVAPSLSGAPSFSPDSRRLLLPTDGAVQVWDLAAGKQALPPLRPNEPPTSAVFSPDGRRILTVQAGACQLWDAETGKPIGRSRPRKSHAFSSDGTQLLLFDQENTSVEFSKRAGVLQVLSAQTGEPAGPPRQLGQGTPSGGFSPDGKVFLVHSREWGIRLLDPWTGQALSTIWPEKGKWWMVPISQSGQAAGFSPDGQHLALPIIEQTRGESGGLVPVFPKGFQVWHARTGTVVSLKHVPTVEELHAFSPDGRKVLVRRSGKSADMNVKEIVEVYDAESGNLLGSPINHQNQETNGALSSDSRRLLTWGGAEARVWDAATGQALTPVLPHGDLVLDAAFFREGPRFVTAGADGLVRVWAPQDIPAARARPGGYVRGFRLSPDGGRLLVSSISPGQTPLPTGTQRLWDVARGQPLIPPVVNYAAAQLGAFAEEGRVLLTWDDHAVQLWDTGTGRPLHPRIESAHQVGLAAVSPRGRRLVVREDRLDKDGSRLESWVRVWDGSTGKPLTKAFAKVGRDAGGYSALELSPDGERLLLFSRSQGVPHLQLWGLETLQPLTPLVPCSRHAFSKDGRHLLTTSDDGQVKVWDVKTGAFLQDLAPGDFPAAGANGRLVVTRVRLEAQVCDATTGQPLAPPLQPRHGVRYAGLVAGGRFVVTLSHPTWGTHYHCKIDPSSHVLPEKLIVSELRLWDPGTGEQLMPALPVTSGSILRWGKPADDVQVTQDGRKLVFCSDLITCDVWELPQDKRPVQELVALAQALSGRRVDESGGTPPLGPKEWLALRARYPETRPVPFDVVRWHDHQAELAEHAGDWQAVREHLDHVIAAEPDVWMHHRRRGRADGRLNDWGACLRDNTRAIELGANIWSVWHNRGYAHPALGHFKEAGDDLEKAAGMEEVWQLTWFNLAEARAFQGDAAGYRRACTGLLSHFGSYSLSNVVWNCCLAPGGVADGNVLIRLAEQDRATLAEQDRPKGQNADALAGARTALGAALYRADKYQEAITVLTENEGLHGAYDGLFLAMAHHRLGQKQQAENYLDESLDWVALYADDSQTGPFYARGPAWNRRQQLRGLSEEAAGLIWGPTAPAGLALRLAEKGHAHNPEGANACNNLAWQLVAGPKTLRDPARALPLAEKAVKLRPGDWFYHNTLGVTLYRLGRYKEAVAALETSLRRQEKRMAAFDLYFLALCHHRLGDEGKAKEEYERAVQAQEQNAQALNADQRAELQAFRQEAEALLKKS
jgi:WD40 repeat protein/tetratricopeptide (TPR) repeat protein